MDFLNENTSRELCEALDAAGYEYNTYCKWCPQNDEINYFEFCTLYPAESFPLRGDTWDTLTPAFTMCELWSMVSGQMIFSGNPAPTAGIAARALWLLRNGYPLNLKKRKKYKSI